MTSYEICKQLHEVSKWENTDKVFRYASEGHYEPVARNQLIDSPDLIPYYDSDYLLEKLPWSTVCCGPGEGMYGAWMNGDAQDTFNEAETPASALALLAIQLIKSGAMEL